MIRKINVKRVVVVITTLAVLILALLFGLSWYMLDYSLSPDSNRRDVDSAYADLYQRFPDMRQWVDSVREVGVLQSVSMVKSDGQRSHALLLKSDSKQARTAIVVHGYRDCCVKFLYLARLYHRDLGFHVLLPDLSAHGLSDGDAVQMGWKDADDLLLWCAWLERESHGEVEMVLHGVSMGAATVMNLSGRQLPAGVKGIVEDCGFTSVWDEFSFQLKEQFSLPPFPLMYTTSWLCQAIYGWNFNEASPLKSLNRCKLPMLFIHGTEDDYVPTDMVYDLYEATVAPKSLWLVPRAGHAQAYKCAPESYAKHVSDFCDMIFEEADE